ncbi:MAG: EpsG family protein [Bacilli bacterium]|nr:EpsG family protein [Bacilli bacterium]
MAMYIFWGIFLTLFACLRECSLNMDYLVYKRLYENTPTLNFLLEYPFKFIKSLDVEFSYGALCAVIKELNLTQHDSLSIIFIIYALIGVPLNIYAIKRITDLEFLTLFIYFCNLYMLHELTQIRAGIATSFILLSIIPLQRNNKSLFSFLILIAGFFHTSAFMGIALLLMKKEPNIKIWGAICSLCIIVFLAKIDISKPLSFIPIDYFQFKLKAYIELQKKEHFEMNYLNIVFLIQITITIICLFYNDMIYKSNKYINILMNMNCLSICCFFFFSQIPGFAYRISEIFNCSVLFLIPLLSKVMKPKFLANLLVITIGFCILCINIFHSNLVNEYKFFWQ